MVWLFVIVFVLVWMLFFSNVHFGQFLFNSHLLSWLVLFFTDEPSLLRSLAGVTVVVTAVIFIALAFNLSAHKSAKGFFHEK